MHFSLFVCALLLTASVLCGNVWGKAFSGLEKENSLVYAGLSQTEGKELNPLEVAQPKNPCVYKGNIVSLDVRKIAKMLV